MENVINSLAHTWDATPFSPLRGMRRWYRKRRMANALAALDDAALKDIGIYRCAIPWIARTQCAPDET